MIPLSIPPEVAVELAHPKLVQSSTHPFDFLPPNFPPLDEQTDWTILKFQHADCSDSG